MLWYRKSFLFDNLPDRNSSIEVGCKGTVDKAKG
jgi:hypothetical protein